MTIYDHKMSEFEELKQRGINLIKMWAEIVTNECNNKGCDFERIKKEQDYIKVLNNLAYISQQRMNIFFNYMERYTRLSHPQKGLFTKLNIERQKIYLMPTQREIILQDLLVTLSEWQEHVINLIDIDETIIRKSLEITAQNIVETAYEKWKKVDSMKNKTAAEVLENATDRGMKNERTKMQNM